QSGLCMENRGRRLYRVRGRPHIKSVSRTPAFAIEALADSPVSRLPWPGFFQSCSLQAMYKPRRLNDHPLRRTSAFLTTVSLVLYTGAALLLFAISFTVYSPLRAMS